MWGEESEVWMEMKLRRGRGKESKTELDKEWRSGEGKDRMEKEERVKVKEDEVGEKLRGEKKDSGSG